MPFRDHKKIALPGEAGRGPSLSALRPPNLEPALTPLLILLKLFNEGNEKNR